VSRRCHFLVSHGPSSRHLDVSCRSLKSFKRRAMDEWSSPLLALLLPTGVFPLPGIHLRPSISPHVAAQVVRHSPTFKKRLKFGQSHNSLPRPIPCWPFGPCVFPGNPSQGSVRLSLAFHRSPSYGLFILYFSHSRPRSPVPPSLACLHERSPNPRPQTRATLLLGPFLSSLAGAQPKPYLLGTVSSAFSSAFPLLPPYHLFPLVPLILSPTRSTISSCPCSSLQSLFPLLDLTVRAS